MQYSAVIAKLGKMHGSLSFQWKGEENQRGRKCWHRCLDKVMRSNRHKWATYNYIHHNPVHHNYVKKWQEWPFSSVHAYLENTDPEIVLKMWNYYPILDYGKGWDDRKL